MPTTICADRCVTVYRVFNQALQTLHPFLQISAHLISETNKQTLGHFVNEFKPNLINITRFIYHKSRSYELLMFLQVIFVPFSGPLYLILRMNGFCLLYTVYGFLMARQILY